MLGALKRPGLLQEGTASRSSARMPHRAPCRSGVLVLRHEHIFSSICWFSHTEMLEVNEHITVLLHD